MVCVWFRDDVFCNRTHAVTSRCLDLRIFPLRNITLHILTIETRNRISGFISHGFLHVKDPVSTVGKIYMYTYMTRDMLCVTYFQMSAILKHASVNYM